MRWQFKQQYTTPAGILIPDLQEIQVSDQLIQDPDRMRVDLVLVCVAAVTVSLPAPSTCDPL